MNSSISSSSRLIAVFAASLVAMLAALIGASEWLVREKAAPADTFGRHVALFQETASPYAAFGDSHVARNFAAAGPVVNLAYPSENIEKMAWKAKRYLDRVERPEAVLIQADAHLFSEYRAQSGLGDYRQAFGLEAPPLLFSLSPRYRPQLIALWKAFLVNGGVLESGIEMTPEGALLSPGDLSRWPEPRIEIFVRGRVELQRPAEDFSSSAEAKAYRDMVARFTESGATVCLVSFPLSPAYRAALDALPDQDRGRYEAAHEFFENLAAAPDVRLIDDRSRYSDPELFRDPDHLNKKGALLYGPLLQDACFGGAGEGARIAAVPLGP